MKNKKLFLKNSKVNLLVISLIFFSALPPIANAAQPEFVGNRIQLEPGMHPVVIAPARAGDLIPTKGSGALYTSGVPNNDPITYTFGNPVLNSPKVILVWYGSWNNDPTQPLAKNNYSGFVRQFVQDYANNARWSLNKKFYSTGVPSSGNIGGLTLGSDVTIKRNDAKYGKTLSQSSILKIAQAAAGSSTNLSEIYLVLTSSDIAVSGFNAQRAQFCGWHSAVSSSNSMKYGFVGDPLNVSGCQGQTSVSPNGNPAADAMVSILAHEIEEAATDPYVVGKVWRDANGYENADKCAWTWGSYSIDSNSGAAYNMTQSGRNYLIQQGLNLEGSKLSTSTTDTWQNSCKTG